MINAHRERRMRALVAMLSMTIVCLAGTHAQCQTRVGSTTQSVGPTVAIGAGQATISSFQGTFTNPNGTPGATSGNTLFFYGNTNGGRLTVDSISTNPASLKYFSNSETAPDTAVGNTAATAFSPTVGFRRQIINNAGATSRLYVRSTDAVAVDIGNPLTFLDLSNNNNSVLLDSNNARLNQILKFDQSNFINPDTGVALATTEGNFSYTFSDYSDGQYRGIDLVYTPVPEPAHVLAVAAGAGLVVTWLRRRRVAVG